MPKVINLINYHVAEDIEKMIYDERYLPGDKLPSERYLSKKYSITRVTLRHSLQRLIDEGIIYSIPNSGNFVSPYKILRDAQHYFFPFEDYFLNDFNYSQEIIDTTVLSHVVGFFEDEIGSRHTYNRTILEKIDDVPIALTSTMQSEESLSKYPNLFNIAKPKNIIQKQRIRVYHANNEEMNLLKIGTNESLFLVNEFIHDETGLIAVCESICIGSRCELQLNINT